MSTGPDIVQERGRFNATLKGVALRAGVSTMTVSRVLNTPDLVNAATRDKVNLAVRELGYVPNLMANGLRSSRSYLVTALVPTITGSLFSEMVRSLTESLEEAGYQLMVGQIGYSKSREDALLRAIVGRRPDGIILTGIMHSPEGRAMLMSSGIPVVETWDSTPEPINMLVALSHEELAHSVCAYLVGKGKRHLAVFSGSDDRARRRVAGFCDKAAHLGLPEPRVVYIPSPTTHGQGRAAFRELLDRGDRVDGVFCSSDMMAAGVLTEARAAGLSIPDALSVVGFGDLDFAATLEPSLTTVRVEGGLIGATAASMIVARASRSPLPASNVNVGFKIMERDSA